MNKIKKHVFVAILSFLFFILLGVILLLFPLIDKNYLEHDAFIIILYDCFILFPLLFCDSVLDKVLSDKNLRTAKKILYGIVTILIFYNNFCGVTPFYNFTFGVIGLFLHLLGVICFLYTLYKIQAQHLVIDSIKNSVNSIKNAEYLGVVLLFFYVLFIIGIQLVASFKWALSLCFIGLFFIFIGNFKKYRFVKPFSTLRFKRIVFLDSGLAFIGFLLDFICTYILIDPAMQVDENEIVIDFILILLCCLFMIPTVLTNKKLSHKKP